MNDPNLERVAKAWAIWVAGDICDDIEERDIIPVGYLDDLKEVLIEHLKDVAVANALRTTSPSPAEPK